MRRLWPSIAVVVGALVLAGCLGGPSATELTNATLSSDPPDSYAFASTSEVDMEITAGDRTGQSVAMTIEGDGALDRTDEVLRADWTFSREIGSREVGAHDAQREMRTVITDGSVYTLGGTLSRDDWYESTLIGDLSQYDRLRVVRRLLGNASVSDRGTATVNGTATRALALNVTGEQRRLAAEIALMHLDLVDSTSSIPLRDVTIEDANVTVWIDPATNHVRRSSIAVEAAIVEEQGEATLTITDTTTYHGFGAEVDDAAPSAAGSGDVGVGNDRETPRAGVNVQYGEGEVTATYVSKQNADQVNVTFSGWGDEATVTLHAVGDRAALTPSGLETTGQATLADAAETWPSEGETVTTTVVAEKDGESAGS